MLPLPASQYRNNVCNPGGVHIRFLNASSRWTALRSDVQTSAPPKIPDLRARIVSLGSSAIPIIRSSLNERQVSGSHQALAPAWIRPSAFKLLECMLSAPRGVQVRCLNVPRFYMKGLHERISPRPTASSSSSQARCPTSLLRCPSELGQLVYSQALRVFERFIAMKSPRVAVVARSLSFATMLIAFVEFAADIEL